MPQLDQLSACPRCEEPLEQGDRFCGACGIDLSAAAGTDPAAEDRPTLAINGIDVPPPPVHPPSTGPAPESGGPQSPLAVPPSPTLPSMPSPVPPPPPPPPVPGARPPGDPATGVPAAGTPPQQPVSETGPPAPQVPPTPTQPDFTLPPPGELPPPDGQSGETAPWPHPEATAPHPEAATPPYAGPDPRTADPRAVRDDAPFELPGQATESGQAAEYGQPAEYNRTAEYGQPAGYEQPGSRIRELFDGPGTPVPPAPAAAPAPAGVPAPDGAADVGGVGSGEPEELGPRCVACGTGAIDDDGYCEHCGHKQPRERDHMEAALDGAAAASDRGLRHHRNEDYFALLETAAPDGSAATIAVVCDGVSSASRSDEASAAAARAAGDSMRDSVPSGRHPQQAMHDALLAASEAVTVLAADAPNEPNKNAPACTIVSSLTSEGILTIGWVGDSRAYWIPEDREAPPSRLTEDDSWAAQMVAAGLMTEEEAYADRRAHAITGWLGADAYELDPHTASFKPDRAGVVVVCTDGLWNYAESAGEMAAAVPRDACSRPLHSARHLVGYALDGGGHDNVTVAVVPFPASAEGAGSA